MTVQRFHDETIDQYSYLLHQGGEAIAVDPCRRISPYLEYLKENNLRLVAIVMTHKPGAFASGWAELRQLTGADIVGATTYKFHGEGRYVEAGRATMIAFGEGSHLQTQLTPGYTADSLSMLAITHDRVTEGIFTGNTLLHDGAGYPLPRPDDKNPLHNEKTYAKETYGSIYDIVRGFDQKATVYSGFGEKAHFSKMGDATHGQFNLTEAQDESPVFDKKKIKNESDFANWLTEDYPFVPAYVAGCLGGNEEGYPAWSVAMAPFRNLLGVEHQESLRIIEPIVDSKGGAVIVTSEDIASSTDLAPAAAATALPLGDETLIIDTREAPIFKIGHPRNAINIQAKGDFALWLGSIVRPGEQFHVLVEGEEDAYKVAQSIAKIGYDREVLGATLYAGGLNPVTEDILDQEAFKKDHVGNYTIIDVRPAKAAIEDTRFYGAINIPVWTLRDRIGEIPRDRPIVVHCGGGYQSAIGASLIRRALGDSVVVYDLGEGIKKFKGV